MKLYQLAIALWTLCSVAASAAHAQGETRTVGPFDAVVLVGASRLEVTVGRPESLVLEGHSGLLRELVTEVRGNTLYVGREAESSRLQGRPDRRVTVRVSLPRLTALRLNGSSQTSITGLAGDSVSVALRGSGQLEAHGQLRTLALQIVGSARADLSGLAVEDAVVAIRGSGRATLQPRQSLSATIRGTGKVTYAGEQIRVTADTSGGGRVERR